MRFHSLRGSGCGTARIGKRSAYVTLVDARMSASRGEHTCVSRNARVEATRMVPSVHQTQFVPGGSEGGPSDGAGKGGVFPFLLVEEGLVSGTFLEWRITGFRACRKAFGGVCNFRWSCFGNVVNGF